MQEGEGKKMSYELLERHENAGGREEEENRRVELQ